MKLRKFYVALLIELLNNKDNGMTTSELATHFEKKQTQGISHDIRVLKEMGYILEKSAMRNKDNREFKHRISDKGIRMLKEYREEVNRPDTMSTFNHAQMQY